MLGIEVSVRPAVRIRGHGYGRGLAPYLSLYDDELDERAGAFWSHERLESGEPPWSELELTDALLHVASSGGVTIARGAACTFPVYYTTERGKPSRRGAAWVAYLSCFPATSFASSAPYRAAPVREDSRKSKRSFRQVDRRRVEYVRSRPWLVRIMVNGVGNAFIAPVPTATGHQAASVASLNGQIRQDKIQLDDWTTCVSSKTPRGQAEIQRLSGQISAAKEHERRVEASPGSIDVWA